MKKQIILDDDDIRRIIAESFSVEKESVELQPLIRLEGYGPSEHYVERVKATVHLPPDGEQRGGTEHGIDEIQMHDL